MEGFLDKLLKITTAVADNIWWPEIPGLPFFPGVVVLLVITGFYMSYVTGFIQIRRLGLAMRLMMRGRSKSDMRDRTGDVTPFQALMTALASTVGNGNVAGVATAIASGGPGAPFWMWITAIFGMSTKYAEGLLGLKYRIKTADGTFSGGTM